MDDAERLALTVLCGELPELRAECARQSERHRRLLAAIEAAARARRPIIPMLGQLLGGDGSGALRALGSALPGGGDGRAHEERFGCPDGACDRLETPLPGGPIPVCRVTGTPMRPG